MPDLPEQQARQTIDRLLVAGHVSVRRHWHARLSGRIHHQSQTVLCRRPTPVPVPPVAEQERIVVELDRRLSVVEELSALVTANRLRQSILQKAFTGELA